MFRRMASGNGRNGGGLLGFGAGIADLVVRVPFSFLEAHHLRKGDAAEVESVRMQEILAALPMQPVQKPGGATANTLYAFAGMGGRAGMLSRFGGDDAGRMLQKHLLGAGCDMSRIRIADGESTGCCLVLITPDSERTMVTMQGAFAGIAPDMFSAADFSGCSCFYMEGYSLYFPETALRLLQLARQQGLCICYDMGSPGIVRNHADLVRKLLESYVDVVFANEQENREFCDGTGLGADALASVCPVTVVKSGAEGACIYEDGRRKFRIPAAGTEVLDTTGAGDYWAAGFLNGWLAHGDLQKAGMQGAVAAAEVIRIPGADLSLSILKQIKVNFL